MVQNMEYDLSGNNKNGYVRKKSVYVLIVVFLVLIIFVGLLSGLLAAKKARKDTEAKYAKETGGIAPTKNTYTTHVAPDTTSVSSTAPGSCTDVWCSIRLPSDVIPYHYNLFIKAYVKQLKYEGKQEAFFKVTKPTNVVIVHIKQMTVDSVSVKSLATNSNIKVARTFPFPENEYYVTVLEENMAVGDYSITLQFKSDVSRLLTGFYKSSYKQDGTERVLLTTKFQPTDARKAFPCFDEPDLKATFNVTMDHPSSHKARSNMPGTTSQVDAERSITTFGKTVKMSTYLICFIVSQFEFKYEGKSGIGNNVTIAVWSRPDYINSTAYAYNTTYEMLTFFEEFLRVPYPMPKLDNFAIPDYGSGATEHWGIITYRETRLLYIPGVSSPSNQKSTAGILAHELAHLWFGNLVTCKWWNDLWVQEGMASYLEYYAMNKSHPEWNMIDRFLSSDWKTGISLDSLASSHPISQPVNHPKQIKEIFDSITYNKGSSLFQMLDHFLGVEKFRQGLNLYLTRHQYTGATVDDLWQAFSNVTNKDIKKMMDTWTHQMGFPVILINKTDASTFQISQKHFLIDPNAVVSRPSKFKHQWIVPFTYATSDILTEKKEYLLESKTVEIKSSASFMLGNYHHRGFYRVNYDKRGWQAITDEINKNFSTFYPTDRAGIIDDAFALARSGEISYSTALNLLSFVENDTNSIVWSMMLDNLDFLGTVLSSQKAYKYYKTFLTKKIEPMYKKSKYMGTACYLGLEQAVTDVKKLFQAWMVNDTAVPADVRSTVYSCALAHGDETEWNFVFKKFMTTDNPSERSKLQSALSKTRNIWLLQKWLKHTLNSSIVRPQDTVYVIRNVAANNPVGKYLAWTFASENWQAIMSIAKENNFHVAVLTSGLTSQFTTQFDLDQVEELWRKYPDAGSGKQARQQGIEKIKSNIDWLKKNYIDVEKWFKENAKK